MVSCYSVILATILLFSDSVIFSLKMQMKFNSNLMVSHSWLKTKSLISAFGLSTCLVFSNWNPYENMMYTAQADARLNAPSAAGTRVNSDPESLLRYGLPIENTNIREIQTNIELIKSDIKGRRIPFAKTDLDKTRELLNRYKSTIISSVNSNSLKKAQLTESIKKLEDDLIPLSEALTSESKTSSGSVQERGFLDEAIVLQDIVSKDLTSIEELLVPNDFRRTIPEEYANLPRLEGRAEVSFVIKKPDGSAYDVDGKLYDQVDIKVVIDGYNAPLTGGNFVDLVKKDYYLNKVITRSDGFVVQTGDANPDAPNPDAVVHGYVPPDSKEERKIPLEIALKTSKGKSELLYGITSEDDGRGAAAVVLPFQSYGALGMARSEYEADSASAQFFWLLFESDLTPAGKNLLDGRYACFGYAVEGADLLKDVKAGDIITSAKVTKGIENLKIN